MRAHVNMEIPSQCEFFSTAGLWTSKSPALRVDANVALQVAEARKRLIASVATKRATCQRFWLIFPGDGRRRRRQRRFGTVRHFRIFAVVPLFRDFLRHGIRRFLRIRKRDFGCVRRRCHRDVVILVDFFLVIDASRFFRNFDGPVLFHFLPICHCLFHGLRLRFNMAEQMVVELGPEEELEMTARAVVWSQSGGAAMLVEHVALQIDGGGEEASAQVAGESRAAGESVLN